MEFSSEIEIWAHYHETGRFSGIRIGKAARRDIAQQLSQLDPAIGVRDAELASSLLSGDAKAQFVAEISAVQARYPHGPALSAIYTEICRRYEHFM